MLVIGLKPSLSQEGFPQSLLIRSFAKLFRQCAGRFRQQRCRALGLEGADYARGLHPSVTCKRGRIRFLGQIEQTPKMRSTSNKTSEPKTQKSSLPRLGSEPGLGSFGLISQLARKGSWTFVLQPLKKYARLP